MVSSAAWSSAVTTTRVPFSAPSVMIISADPASTGSPPSRPSVTGLPVSATASAMIVAGRACSPTAEPTVAVVLGMGTPSSVVVRYVVVVGRFGAGERPGCQVVV